MNLKSKSPSGKFVLRVSPKLHRAIQQRADKDELSLNSVCTRILEQGLTESAGSSACLEQQIIAQAQQLYSASFTGLLLFGSQARGDTHDQSDIDLLIVLDNSIAIRRELYKAWSRNLPEKVSIHFSHLPKVASQAGSLWLECALDARILFDPKKTIARKLSEIRQFATSGKVIRKSTHGQGYWVYL